MTTNTPAPSGLKAVPREATPEQIEAGRDAASRYVHEYEDGKTALEPVAAIIYRAMVEAAPGDAGGQTLVGQLRELASRTVDIDDHMTAHLAADGLATAQSRIEELKEERAIVRLARADEERIYLEQRSCIDQLTREKEEAVGALKAIGWRPPFGRDEPLLPCSGRGAWIAREVHAKLSAENPDHAI